VGEPVPLNVVVLCAAMLAGAVQALPADAQSPAPPSAVGRRLLATPLTFSSIFGAEVMADGGILLVDSRDRTIMRVEPGTAAVRAVGRRGEGPNEYVAPFGPVRGRGDTLFVFDAGARRLLRVLPDGRLDGGVPLPSPAMRRGLAPPRGVDSAGYFYWDAPTIAPDANGRFQRSPVLTIWRWRPGMDAPDSVAGVQDHAGFQHGRGYVAFPYQDDWVVTGTGDLVVARAEPFRVDRLPRGRPAIAGPRIPLNPVRVTAREREAFRADHAVASGSSVRMTGAGARTEATRRQTAAAWPDELFPPVLPPFLERTARLAPDGTLWIPRSRASTDPVPTVDLVGPDGVVRVTVALPARSRLLSVGRGTVLLARVDDDGLQGVELYELSRAAR
jgi:hypothetical protein